MKTWCAWMLLKNAKVVSSFGIKEADILLEGEKIAKVGRGLSSSGEEVLDCTSLLVFPGATDAHVHFRVPGGEEKEDFYTGSRGALAGGVTCVLDMPNNPIPTVTKERLEEKVGIASKTSVCDFGFHFGAAEGNLEEVRRAKPSSLKMYMGQSTGNLGISEKGIRGHFENFPKEKPVCLHAEDQGLIEEFSRGGGAHEEARNSLVSAVAVCKAVSYAVPLGRRIHFCHLGTETEVALARTYRKASVEVTPHNLLLSQKDIPRLGFLKNVNPALRKEEEALALWGSLPSVDIIASDHAPHTLAEKKEGASGFPGVQTMLPLMIDAASKGRIKLEEIARLLCENPPKIFGLGKRGRIAPGFLADLVLVDLKGKWKVKGSELESRCGWTPYEGMELSGRIVKAIRRGQAVFEDGEILAKKGTGKLVMR